ncbi:hypothetical protein SLS63_003547 [Diaporthe eres]|uniref:O-methyltransferase n=1 Tax=Diaporthe eres TaxID=83184 RepID=A0ABR1PGN1_DIAER
MADEERIYILETLDGMDKVRNLGNFRVVRTILETIWKPQDLQDTSDTIETKQWWLCAESSVAHISQLLSELHAKSLEQESVLSKTGKIFSSKVIGDLEDQHSRAGSADAFDKLMLDKFIALDEDKCHFTYQLITAMGATNVVEAGTSFGVSTIYLALAVGKAKAATGKSGTVIATEKETQKAEIARGYWAQCGAAVEQEIDLRVGNLLETLKEGLPQIDLLLLDIWSALSLPTLKVVLPRLRKGAVILTDNTISGAEGYKDLLAFLRDPQNGFQNMTLPFTNGFEMSVYMSGLE